MQLKTISSLQFDLLVGVGELGSVSVVLQQAAHWHLVVVRHGEGEEGGDREACKDRHNITSELHSWTYPGSLCQWDSAVSPCTDLPSGTGPLRSERED